MVKQSFQWVRLIVLLCGLVLAGCAGLPSVPAAGSADADSPSGLPVEAEFTGAVQVIDSTAWQVAGLAFVITPDTEFQGDIALGDTVQVHARVAADGSLTAREIALQQTAQQAATPVAGDEVEFTGPVEAISATSWTIGGTPVAVTPETEIDPGLAVGDVVKVHALLAEDGSLTAREIDRADVEELGEDPDDNEIKFVGTVEAMGATSWTIAGVVVLINSGTDIDEGITVGSLVRVEAFSDASGVLTATEIETDEGEDSSGNDDLEDDSDDSNSDSDDDDAEDSDDGEDQEDSSGHGGSDD